jgi:serpin B
MKKISLLFTVAALAAITACSELSVTVKNPINVSSPVPTEQITKVSLDATQQGYVQAGNAMAFRFLDKMYDGNNLILSPLSLQYALAMTANGASGETLQQIIDFLGYGADGIDALNTYCKTMLEQLPAVDLDITLKLTDALLVNDRFPLLPSFQKTVQDYYYAAVENMDFSDPAQVAATINDWANRSTNGFIDKVLESSEISAEAVAFLMNALYFKAKWAGTDYSPMFRDYATKSEKFTLSDGSTRQVSMMNNMKYHRYAEMDGYKVLALPYANGKFFMYILLPDKNDLDGLVKKLPGISWKEVLSSFNTDAEVYVKLPKFEVENKFELSDALNALGVKRPFVRGAAEFGQMFQPQEQHYDYWIGKVIQKARIAVDEWGTEAAAVTVVEMMGATSPGPGQEPKRVNFYADHPFVFLIGEATSGTILFEGTYTGKK